MRPRLNVRLTTGVSACESGLATSALCSAFCYLRGHQA
jgi:hypothetical protein